MAPGGEPSSANVEINSNSVAVLMISKCDMIRNRGVAGNSMRGDTCRSKPVTVSIP